MSLTESWRRLRSDPPGARFTQRYERLHRAERSVAGRVARLGAGVVLVLLGVVFMPLPGPGFVPLALGGALLAGESLRIARWLDRTELRLRGRRPAPRHGRG